MTVYITPGQQDSFSKKIYNMTKHLKNAPNIEFSEPKNMFVDTLTIVNNGWGIDGTGAGGRKRRRQVMSLVEVTIDDITEGDWVMVADVFYQENLVTMRSNKYYGMIPEQYGLDYTKCDYCGKVHANRKVSHIIYNTVTGEWKQVGSACIAKMFDSGKYMSNFTVSLFRLIEEHISCCDYDGLRMFVNAQPDHSMGEAFLVADMIACVQSYKKNITDVWQKSWNDHGCFVPGTSKFLNDYFNEHFDELIGDSDYAQKVHDFVINEIPAEDGYSFNDSIRRTFSGEYATRADFAFIWFGCKKYEESLAHPEWDALKEKMPLGTRVNIKNAVICSQMPHTGMFGISWATIFQDENGIKYTKNLSNPISFSSTYGNDEHKHSFSTVIEGYDNRNQMFYIGRASKVK